MWEPVTFFCFTRRTGCFKLGRAELIASIIRLLVGAYLFTILDQTMTNKVCKKETLSKLNTDCDGLTNTVYGLLAVYMILCVIKGVCVFMLLYGVMKNKPILIVPFMIRKIIVIALGIIIFGIASVMILRVSNFFYMIVYASCHGALIFLWTYYLLTVRAYYYELKRGKSDDHQKLVAHCDVENGHTDT